MNDLSSKLLDVILKDLPNQTSGPLREYMNQAEQAKTALAQQIKNNDDLASKITKLEIKEKELHGELEKYIKLEKEYKEGIVANAKKQLELQTKEINLELTLTKSRLEDEIRITIQQEKFLALLVKNPVSMEYFKESKYAPGGYTNNSDGSTTHHYGGDKVEERTQKIEKTKE
jgi:hypothetical protein